MSAKKGKKSKGTTLSLQEFNSRMEDGKPSAGQNVIYASKKKEMTSWADEVEEDDFVYEKISLPSAPRAVRGPNVDDSQIPKEPPFMAHLGNLSYDIGEDDVYKFFRDLEVAELRLPRDTNSNRLRGFGYVEFRTREDLVQALCMNETMLKGRPLRVNLQGPNHQNRFDGEGGQRRGGDRGGDRGSFPSDETPDDWRSSMKATNDMDYPQPGAPSYFRGRDRDGPRERRSDMYGGGMDRMDRGSMERGMDRMDRGSMERGMDRMDRGSMERGMDRMDRGSMERGMDRMDRGRDRPDRGRDRMMRGTDRMVRGSDRMDRGMDRMDRGSMERGMERMGRGSTERGMDRMDRGSMERGMERSEMDRPARSDNRDRDTGRRDFDRGYQRPSHDDDEGPSDWRSNMKPREETHRPVEPPFERRQPEEPRRERDNRESRQPPPAEPQPSNEPPRERKKLVIAPRTVPVAPGEGAAEIATSAIFGGAKPVDTAAREREIEQKLADATIKPKKEVAAVKEEANGEPREEAPAFIQRNRWEPLSEDFDQEIIEQTNFNGEKSSARDPRRPKFRPKVAL